MGAYDCDSNSVCIANSDGISYTCKCKDGYKKDGSKCEKEGIDSKSFVFRCIRTFNYYTNKGVIPYRDDLVNFYIFSELHWHLLFIVRKIYGAFIILDMLSRVVHTFCLVAASRF